MTVTPVVISVLSTVTEGTGGLGNKRTSGDHPSESIVEIGQNTEKSSEDLMRRCHSDSNGKPSAYAGVKSYQKSRIIMLIIIVVSRKMPTWTGDKSKNQDHLDHSTTEISWDTEKSPGDLKRLAVTQNLVKNHHLKTAVKNRHRVKVIKILLLERSRKWRWWRRRLWL